MDVQDGWKVFKNVWISPLTHMIQIKEVYVKHHKNINDRVEDIAL